MPIEFDTGIIVPDATDKHPSAAWWRTIGATTSAAIRAAQAFAVAATTAQVDALRATTVSKADAEQYGIPGPPGTGLPGPPGGPGPIGPGGSISLVETSTGCFTESPTTWMKWGTIAGKTVSAWNPATQTYDLVSGDTGLWDITALCTGVESGKVYLQRTGNNCVLLLDSLKLLATVVGASHNLVATGVLPVGFRPQLQLTELKAAFTTSFYSATEFAQINAVVTTAGRFTLSGTTQANHTYRWPMRWTTNQAWPTSVPAGVIVL